MVNSISRSTAVLLAGTGLLGLVAARPSYAYEYSFPNGVEIQFQNTAQYSVLERTAPQSPVLLTNINADDGDKNLAAGIVSNRFDLLSKFDISDQGFGFDVSTDSFYDTVYNEKTQNTDAASYNAAFDPPSKFTSATIAQAGRDIQLRTLFAYGTYTIGNVPVTVRTGRLVNLFDESLLFAANGISYGQAPIDIERAASVPNTQAKDLFLPAGPAPGAYFYHANDLKGANTGQFGVAVHYDPVESQYDLGFYALQYNDSEPQVYVRPGGGRPAFIPGSNVPSLAIGTYQLVYRNHIQIYGISGTTTLGPTNYAGEISARTNEPLASSVTWRRGSLPTTAATRSTPRAIRCLIRPRRLKPDSYFTSGELTARAGGS
jgi:hypothetical protein